MTGLFGPKRPAYQSAKFEGAAGESEARLYYMANLDKFAVNPPDSYSSDPVKLAPTGGWLDNR